VKVGHRNNPNNIHGMAHLIEHMLFMSNETNKPPNYLQQYISKNGGKTNAFTTMTDTCYYYDVNKNFIESLKLFTNMFIEPKFISQNIESEINIVQSEHDKNINSNNWRLEELMNQFVDQTKDNYHNKFGCGNIDTLSKPLNHNTEKIKSKLKTFFKNNYSAHKMTVYIQTNNNNHDEIIKILEKIKLKKTKHQISNKIIFDNKQQIIVMKSIDSTKSINMRFCVKNTLNHKSINTFFFFGYLLNSTRKYSLYYYLKKHLLINTLSVIFNCNYNDNYTFDIRIELTENGLKNWNVVIKIFFNYIKQIRNMNHKLFKYYLSEYNYLQQLEFNNNTNNVNIIDYVEEIFQYNIQQNYFITYKYHQLSINEYLKYFSEIMDSINENNLKMIIISPNYGNIFQYTDKYYPTKYSFIPNKLKINYNLKLNYPEKNQYLKFDTKNNMNNSIDNRKYTDKFTKIDDNSKNIYYEKLNYQKNIKSSIDICFRLKSLNNNYTENSFLIEKYIDILKIIFHDELACIKEIADINFDVINKNLVVNIDTYSYHVSDITNKLIDILFLSNYDIKKIIEKNNIKYIDNLEERKEELNNYWYNSSYKILLDEIHNKLNPLQIGYKKFNKIFYKFYDVSLETILNKGKKLISTGEIIGIFNGNIIKTDIQEIIQKLNNHIKYSEQKYELSKLNFKNYDFKIMSKIEQNNIALVSGIYLGEFDLNTNKKEYYQMKLHAEIIKKYLQNDIYNYARNKYQLGYIIRTILIDASFNRFIKGNFFICAALQTKKYKSKKLLEDYFSIDNIGDKLSKMTKSEYEEIKTNIVNELYITKDINNMSYDVENRILLKYILTQKYRNNKLINELQIISNNLPITKLEYVNFINNSNFDDYIKFVQQTKKMHRFSGMVK
jgi:secreted Zn-dependent insulinase-like peptidase